MVRVCQFLIIIGIACSASVFAASFDCTKAATAVEKMICSDNELSALDSKLADTYRNGLRTAQRPEPIKDDQKAWLRMTRNRCSTVDCLQNAYKQRLQILTDITKTAPQSVPERILGDYKKTVPVCLVADNAQGYTCEGTAENRISLKPSSTFAVAVEISLIFFNAHTCEFSADGLWNGKTLVATSREFADDKPCIVTLSFSGNAVTSKATDGCQTYCGARGTLDGITLTK